MGLRDKASVGRRISELLAGRSQRELAESVNITPSTLSRVVSGKRTLNMTELAAIAAYLGVSADDLLFEDKPVFCLRSDGDDGDAQSAVKTCSSLIEEFLIFETAARW